MYGMVKCCIILTSNHVYGMVKRCIILTSNHVWDGEVLYYSDK